MQNTLKMNEVGEALLQRLDRLYVINLAHRTDRRAEMEGQLALLGLSFSHESVELFPACSPEDTDGFASPGANGCYQSHVACMKDALARGSRAAWLAEDDCDFAGLAPDLLAKISEQDWDIVYFGYVPPGRFEELGAGVHDVGAQYDIGGTHLLAIHSDTIPDLLEHLDAAHSALRRGEGRAGHLDAMISDYRKARPNIRTLIACPALGVQRRSRSDVQELGLHDRLPVIRRIIPLIRRLAPRR